MSALTKISDSDTLQATKSKELIAPIKPYLSEAESAELKELSGSERKNRVIELYSKYIDVAIEDLNSGKTYAETKKDLGITEEDNVGAPTPVPPPPVPEDKAAPKLATLPPPPQRDSKLVKDADPSAGSLDNTYAIKIQNVPNHNGWVTLTAEKILAVLFKNPFGTYVFRNPIRAKTFIKTIESVKSVKGVYNITDVTKKQVIATIKKHNGIKD
jgi:hypothetical protein